MEAFAGQRLLTAWELSRTQSEQHALLSLMVLAAPEHSIDEWALLPLGERNAFLLELRAALFGTRMEGFATCPECGADLELAVDPRALARGLRSEPAKDSEEIAGFRMRPMNSLDLVAVSRAGSEDEAREILLSRSLGLEPEELPQLEESIVKLTEQFERINTSAEIRVKMDCPVCRNRPVLDLDIAPFLLREVALAARRLMSDIHELASAYGWSEEAIASMSAARRAAYLEMLSA